MDIKRVGVVGCGIMGSGIAQAAAVSGFQVQFVARSKEKVERDMARIRKSFSKAVEKNKLSQEKSDRAMEKIHGTDRLEDLHSCDLAIETIIENLKRKKEVFKQLDEILPSHAALTTNTSSFSVTEIGAATRRPGQVAGMHFFVPAQAMKLVEVVRGDETTDETVDKVAGFARAMGKEPVTVSDTPGFIVNQILVPYLNQAIQALDDGLACREDIDKAIRLGFGITLGPLAMLDLIGLDIQLYMAETLFAKSGDKRFEPPPLLRRMVEEGKLGRKTGKGFYEYD